MANLPIAQTNYKIRFKLNPEFEIILGTQTHYEEPTPSIWTNLLNISQLASISVGTKLEPAKARDVLDTTISELLPTQTTRQDQINEFFNEFNNLIGNAPPFQDNDGDGAGEFIPDAGAADYYSRISAGDTPTAFITRLDGQANNLNQGKTLESMRNELNLYLGDVDNVVQVLYDQRPEYVNKSRGFLKIRKPNQAIILRAPGAGELEFQKEVTTAIRTGPSFLVEGFTITMWVRFVGKSGGGTLFNFANPTSTDTPYGFRLETIADYRTGSEKYERIVRLIVRDGEDLYDSSFGRPGYDKYNTIEYNYPAYWPPNNTDSRFHDHVKVPTDDLNEWFFICATYNPNVDEVNSFGIQIESENANEGPLILNTDKQFWLNHRDKDTGDIVSNTLYGARCKVEVISKSDLLRARGFKVTDVKKGRKPSLELNVETEQEQSSA